MVVGYHHFRKPPNPDPKTPWWRPLIVPITSRPGSLALQRALRVSRTITVEKESQRRCAAKMEGIQ